MAASPIGRAGLNAAVFVASGLYGRVRDTVPILRLPVVGQIVTARGFNSRCVKSPPALLL